MFINLFRLIKFHALLLKRINVHVNHFSHSHFLLQSNFLKSVLLQALWSSRECKLLCFWILESSLNLNLKILKFSHYFVYVTLSSRFCVNSDAFSFMRVCINWGNKITIVIKGISLRVGCHCFSLILSSILKVVITLV